MDSLRPLRDGGGLADPDLAAGAALLERVGPTPRSEARKRRVWSSLATGSPRRLIKLTAAHIAFASVLVAAASSAAVGHYYTARQAPLLRSAVAPAIAPASPKAQKRELQARAQPTPSVTPSTPTQREPSTERATPPRKLEAPRSKTSAADAEAKLLVEAMRARGAGDSKRVSELADEYLAKHPRGALQEEALILAIESAVARRAPNVQALAREYLARFPSGRFAAQARRAATLETR